MRLKPIRVQSQVGGEYIWLRIRGDNGYLEKWQGGETKAVEQ